MTFWNGIGAPTEHTDTTLDGWTLVNGLDPALEILVGASVQILLFQQTLGPLVVHNVSNGVFVAAQILFTV